VRKRVRAWGEWRRRGEAAAADDRVGGRERERERESQ
jgi:hypothetical protein